MKITCLMENTIGNEICQSEHGLSLYVETENETILIDTGASGLFLENAKNLEVDLTKAETVFLSHGHYDHGGGILDFYKVNPTAKIIMQKSALGDYWHKEASIKKYIGLNPKIAELNSVMPIEGEWIYSDSIQVFTGNFENKEELKCWPKGNLVLKKWNGIEYIQDQFEHEQYVAVKENGKSVLISGCAHNGILNILDEYCRRYEKNPDVIISGFHMRKKTGYSLDDYDVIQKTAEVLKCTGILCYTGHCTGEEPYYLMKKIMGEQLQYVHCGDVIII